MKNFKRIISVLICLAVMAVYMPSLGISVSADSGEVVAFDNLLTYSDLDAAKADGWTSNLKTYAEMRLDENGNPQYRQHTSGTGAFVTNEPFTYTFPLGKIAEDSANGTAILTNKYKGKVRLDLTYDLNITGSATSVAAYFFTYIRGGDSKAINLRTGTTYTYVINSDSTATGKHSMYDTEGNADKSGNIGLNNSAVEGGKTVSFLFDLTANNQYGEQEVYAKAGEGVTEENWTVHGKLYSLYSPPRKETPYIDNITMHGMQRALADTTFTFKEVKLTVLDPGFTAAENTFLSTLPENLDSYFASGETRDSVSSSFTLPSIDGVTWKGDGDAVSVSNERVNLSKSKTSEKAAKITAEFTVGGIDYKKEYNFTVAQGKNQIRYYLEDGVTIFETLDVADGGYASNISAPQIGHYDFSGWYEKDSGEPFDFSTPINGDMELYAKYTPAVYNVYFYAEETLVATLKATYNNVVTGTIPEIPAVAGKTGIEWQIRGTGKKFTADIVVTGDTYVDAYYRNGELKSHTVTFVSDGTTYKQETVFSGYTISKPDTDPSKEHSVFKYWALDGEEYDFSEQVYSDMTLEAVFGKEPLSVKFYDEDKTTLLYEGTGYYGEAYTDFPEAPMTEDYRVLDKWNISDTEVFESGTVLTAPIVVYASYVDKSKVIFDNDYTTVKNFSGLKNWQIKTTDHTAPSLDGGPTAKQIKSTPYSDLATQNTSQEHAIGATFEGTVSEDRANRTTVKTDRFAGVYRFDIAFDYAVKDFNYEDLAGYSGTKYSGYYSFVFGQFANAGETTPTTSTTLAYYRFTPKTIGVYNNSSAGSSTLTDLNGAKNVVFSPAGNGQTGVLHFIADTDKGRLTSWYGDDESKAVVGPFASKTVKWFNGFSANSMPRMDIGTYLRFKNIKITQVAVNENDESYKACMDVMYNQLPEKLERNAEGNFVLPNIKGVEWSTSNGIVDKDGIVSPSYEDTDVVITARYAAGNYRYMKNYTVTVEKLPAEKVVKLDGKFTSDKDLMNWDMPESSASGTYSADENGLKIEKLSSSKSLTTTKKTGAYSAYYSLYSADREYDSAKKSATYSKEYSGIYDIDITALAKISSAAPAQIVLGYKNGNVFYQAASLNYSKSSGLRFVSYQTSEVENDLLIAASFDDVKNLKIRINTKAGKLWILEDGVVLNSNAYSFYNTFGGDEYKMFNSIGVILDENNDRGDYIQIKEIKLTQLDENKISEKQELISASDGLEIGAITDSPDSLTGSLKNLPKSIENYSVKWAVNTDQIDVDTLKVYQSSAAADAIISAYISVGNTGLCTVRKDFYVTIPSTTDGSKLAEYELSKLGKITNQPYDSITYDLNLPSAEGVVWSSSDTSVISDAGKINVNALLTEDKTVTLTASKDGQSIEIPLVVKKRAPIETLYERTKPDADGKFVITKSGISNIKVLGNSSLSFEYTNDGTAFDLYVKDSNGAKALDIKFADGKIVFGYKGSDMVGYAVADGNTAAVKVEILPSVNRAAVSVDGKLIYDYVELENDISDFALLEASNASAPIKNIKLEAEGYTILDVNKDNIDYFGEVSRDYVSESITPVKTSVTGAKTEWISGNTSVISDDGILSEVKVPQFVGITLKITNPSDGRIYREYTRELFADCSPLRNVFAGASTAINSVPTSSMPKENAVDGKILTAFEMNGLNTLARCITLDLGSEKTFNSVYVNADGIDGYTISVSPNNTSWTDVKTAAFSEGCKGSFVSFGSMATARYVRLTADKNSNASAKIYEIKGYINASAEELARLDLNAITLPTLTPSSDISLPLVGANGTKFTWKSSDPSVISDSGKVTVPSSSTTVTLTVSAEGISDTRTFELVVGGSSKPSGPSVVTGGGGGGGAGGGSQPSTGASSGVIIGNVEPGTTFNGDEVSNGNNNILSTGYYDVAAGSWYADAVKKLTEKKIVSGDGSGMFYPLSSVTREQFVKMLLLASGTELKEVPNTFGDVAADSWYAPYVATALNLGIVRGVSDSEFGIGTNITRQDMAVLIARILESRGVSLDTKSPAFTDDKEISNYAYDAVYAMKNLGIINGSDGAFNPKANLTRAEAAKVISSLMDYLEKLDSEKTDGE